MTVEAGFTRLSIATQLRERLNALGVEWSLGCQNERDGLRYVIEGVSMTAGEAADRYLPGGFAGSFGRGPE